MVTATQVSRLDAKLDALVTAIDTDNQPITVVVFRGETREFALQRHRELRPDHAGRLVRFEYRSQERDDVREMFAVQVPQELQAVIDRIEAEGRGKPIGEQVLDDAHGGVTRTTVPTIPINLRSDPSLVVMFQQGLRRCRSTAPTRPPSSSSLTPAATSCNCPPRIPPRG